MGFTVAPAADGSVLSVQIEYDVPGSLSGRVLSWLLGDAYSRWCLRRMCDDARAAIAPRGPLAAGR